MLFFPYLNSTSYLNALSNISRVGFLVCPPYIFVVCRLANEYVITDTHVIKSQLGGNDNGTVIALPFCHGLSKD